MERRLLPSPTRSHCPFVLIGRDPRSDLILDHAADQPATRFLQAVARPDSRRRPSESHQGLLGRRRHSPSQGLARSEQVHPGRSVPDSPVGGISGPESAGWPSPIVARPRTKSQAGSRRRPPGLAGTAHPDGPGPSLWPLGGQMVFVGRSADCELVLNDESVSRFHAALGAHAVGNLGG